MKDVRLHVYTCKLQALSHYLGSGLYNHFKLLTNTLTTALRVRTEAD